MRQDSVNDRLYYTTKHVDDANGVEPFTKPPPGLPSAMHQFVNAAAGQKDQPLVTPAEAVARLSAMEAMYAVARQRTWLQPS